jgi:hypothetical protein
VGVFPEHGRNVSRPLVEPAAGHRDSRLPLQEEEVRGTIGVGLRVRAKAMDDRRRASI